MEQELLHYLLAAFPDKAPAPPPEAHEANYLVIHGYRVPFESPVDDVMLGILAEFRRRGFNSDAVSSIDRG